PATQPISRRFWNGTRTRVPSGSGDSARYTNVPPTGTGSATWTSTARDSAGDADEVVGRPRPRHVEHEAFVRGRDLFGALHELEPRAALDQERRAQQPVGLPRERHGRARGAAQLA